MRICQAAVLLAFWPLLLAADEPAQQARHQAEIEKLIEQLSDNAFEQRETATKRLAEIGRPAMPLLERAAQDANPETRLRAMRVLAEIDPAMQHLTALSSPDRQTRTAALRSLAGYRRAMLVPALLKLLEDAPARPRTDDERKYVRALLAVVGCQQDRRATPELGRMLLASDDMRADPSAQIVAAMARIADPAAADVLLKYVETRQAGGAELADALGATCDPRCVGPLLDLMEEAYDGDYGMLVQQAGVRGLANIGAAAVSPLAQEYPRRRDFVKRNIATALGKIGGDEAQELLATYLEGEASYEAAAALDRLGDPRGAAYIRDELERLLNADEPVPVELYYALEQCQGESLHAICLRLIDSPVFSARWAAAESLARQGDEVGWRFFRTRLEDDEQASRAIYALARLGDAASTKDIARLARHRQQDIVQASIHALAQLQNREAALALLNLGQGPRTVRGYAELRRDSVRALAAYPAQEVMNVVVELLDDDDERVVHFAYMALSEIAGDNLVDAEHWRRWWAYHRSDYSPQVPTDVSANKSAW